jgi:rSAM/selenodomain-associated transferase 2
LISIVIPVRDDADALAYLLTIEPHDDVEIIVVNGGASNGRLTAVTERRDVRRLSSALGRGRQMNVGTLMARGRWFVFVHADTRLPPQWLSEIRRVDADPAIVGGSFRFQLDSAAWQARLIERGVRWRVRRLDLAYGDQALFVRRDAFHAIGGYREWPLMEDVALIRGLRKLGRLYHSALPVETSADRRWATTRVAIGADGDCCGSGGCC